MSSSVAVLWVAAASPNSDSNCGLIRVLESSRLFSPCLNQKVIKSKRKHTTTTKTWRSSSVRNGVISSSLVASPTGEITLSSEEKVYNVVLKQAALVNKQLRSSSCPEIDVKKTQDNVVLPGTLSLLGEAYDRCGEVCAEYAKTFYLGTLLMTPERRKAIWAIYGELIGHY